MVRVPEITKREQLPEGQRHFYDSIIASRKRIGAPYNFLLHAPDLAARTAYLIEYSLFGTDFPRDVKELAICTVARGACVFAQRLRGFSSAKLFRLCRSRMLGN